MNKTALELYLYMNNSGEIVKWLKEEGVKTKEESKINLAPLVESNIRDVFRIGAGSLAGTSNCIEKVLDLFPDKEEK